MHEIVLFLGPTGYGKSTLLNCWAGRFFAPSGNNRFDLVSSVTTEVTHYHYDEDLEYVDTPCSIGTTKLDESTVDMLRSATEVYFVCHLEAGRLLGSFVDMINTYCKVIDKYDIIINRYDDVDNTRRLRTLCDLFLTPPQNVIVVPDIKELRQKQNSFAVFQKSTKDGITVCTPTKIIHRQPDMLLDYIVHNDIGAVQAAINNYADISEVFVREYKGSSVIQHLLDHELWDMLVFLMQSGAILPEGVSLAEAGKTALRGYADTFTFSKGDQIGQGSYTTIHNCTWQSIKAVSKRYNFVATTSFVDTDLWRYVRKDAILMKLSRHPNLVRIYTQYDNMTAICEKCDGNLEKSLPYLTIAQKLKLCVDVCSGIQYLHMHGYSHGDLNPRSVFTKKIGDVVLGKVDDFGAASVVLRTVPTTKWRPKPQYRAPEFFQEMLHLVDRNKADIYALGGVIVFIFSGSHCFSERYKKSFYQIFSDKGDAFDNSTPMYPEAELDAMRECCGNEAFYQVTRRCFETIPQDRPILKDILLTLVSREEYDSIRDLHYAIDYS